MSTNLEYRAGERQRKRESQAAGQRSSMRKRATEIYSEREKTKETFFLLEEQHEHFVAAVTK